MDSRLRAGMTEVKGKIHKLCKYRTFIRLKSGRSQTIVGLLIHRMCIYVVGEIIWLEL